ncbi:TIGR00725 family protein [Paraburkholderia sp. IMGN_8]|uniref:TIGR00725 family protein n=1 Tax=Paraburkholderia sp. IMGN_8 TaxID=3136564 RepID=UPI0031013FD2
MPIGLIGPREATAGQLQAARSLGYALADAGMTILCGGKGGVMEAAAFGAARAGGIVIGLLPEDDANEANPFLTVALPTGMGITRNALIARASLCLIAIGGGLGTLSEMALGLQWNKPVFTLLDAPQVSGAEVFEDVDALAIRVANWLVSAQQTQAAAG